MRYLIVCLLCGLLFQSQAQQTPPFSKGVNLTNWFQVNGPRQIQFTRYTREDFVDIQSLGCDVIRLPINLHAMTLGAPAYQLDPFFLNFLDSAVSWAEELQIHLILDNHTFDPATNTDPAVEQILVKVWKQMAQHYQTRSGFIHYEVLNEPHGISNQLWGQIQQNVIDTIRTVDNIHSIVVGPANWNSLFSLDDLPFYADTNLIYTFHFYEPFIFTHQGASWTSPSMAPLANVPFPYHPDSMPAFPAALNGTWIQNSFNNYSNDGTVAQVQNFLDVAIQFQQARNVPIFCGEFGVYIPNSQNHHRTVWYQEVRSYMEANNVSWTSWDYHGGFGIFNPGGNDLFDHDLNVALLTAMGLNVPPQTPFTITPDSLGLLIYTDFTERDIKDSHYTSGTINAYSEDKPNYGQYCLRWDNPSIYNAVGYDFVPNRDFSGLESSAYAIDFFLRGNMPGTKLDIRFLDTKTSDPNDHPWRMNYTLNTNMVSSDSRWQHIRVPLNQFSESGSWDNNQWFNPQGDFDWTAIDRFEIVTEYGPVSGGSIWIDQLQISNQDTAMVNDTTAFTTSIEDEFRPVSLLLYPNPGQEQLFVETELEREVQLELLDITGRVCLTQNIRRHAQLDVSPLPSGLYRVRIMDQGRVRQSKAWAKVGN